MHLVRESLQMAGAGMFMVLCEEEIILLSESPYVSGAATVDVRYCLIVWCASCT